VKTADKEGRRTKRNDNICICHKFSFLPSPMEKIPEKEKSTWNVRYLACKTVLPVNC
jgi:hypothetical protein